MLGFLVPVAPKGLIQFFQPLLLKVAVLALMAQMVVTVVLVVVLAPLRLVIAIVAEQQLLIRGTMELVVATLAVQMLLVAVVVVLVRLAEQLHPTREAKVGMVLVLQ
jgi:hypothetical protein